MRDGVTLWQRLSLTGRNPRISPGNVFSTRATGVWFHKSIGGRAMPQAKPTDFKKQHSIIMAITLWSGQLLKATWLTDLPYFLLSDLWIRFCDAPILQWRHNDCGGISNHRHLDCLFILNCLFRCRSKKTSKLQVTGLSEGNPLMTDGFPSQRACNVEKVSIRWFYHETGFIKFQFGRLGHIFQLRSRSLPLISTHKSKLIGLSRSCNVFTF